MRTNGCTSSGTKYGSWGKNELDRVSNELTCRKLYGDKCGIQFESETVVLKSKQAGGGYDVAQERMSETIRRSLPKEKSRDTKQSTIGSFSSSSSSSGKSYGTGFFNRLIKEMEHREVGYTAPKKSGSWLHGVGDNVPSDKRACLERHLRWLEDKVDKNTAPQAAQPVQSLPSVEAPVTNPGNHELFNTIRSRIGNLLMHELPHEVTAELRQLAREIEQLHVTVN